MKRRLEATHVVLQKDVEDIEAHEIKWKQKAHLYSELERQFNFHGLMGEIRLGKSYTHKSSEGIGRGSVYLPVELI